RGRQFVKMGGFDDRPTGFIHVGARQQQKRARAAERSFAGDPLKAPAPRTETVALGDLLNGEEADIVPVADMARSRIAEPNQEQHGDFILCRMTSLFLRRSGGRRCRGRRTRSSAWRRTRSSAGRSTFGRHARCRSSGSSGGRGGGGFG